MTAEFFGTDFEIEPGPRHFKAAEGRRKLVMQTAVEARDVRYTEDRQNELATQAARAVGVFASSGRDVDWHTLTFQVTKSGMEMSPDDELWRWEVWAQ